jgi:carbon storage regulator CsrA
MLVLSRKNRESVVIGGDDGVHRLLKVTVLGIQGANVKLGFEVDADVPVYRAEVWDRIDAESPSDCLTVRRPLAVGTSGVE